MPSADALFEQASLTPKPPMKVALAPVRRAGAMLFVSGQVAARAGTLIATGLVGRDVSMDVATECARQCSVNVLSVVLAEFGTLDVVQAVVRVGVYVACVPTFTEQHLVAHGASQLLLEVFPEMGLHTRTAIGVASLPLNTPVEMDAVFEIDDEGHSQ